MPLDGLPARIYVSAYWDGARYVVTTSGYGGVDAKRLGIDAGAIAVVPSPLSANLLPNDGDWLVVGDHGTAVIRRDLAVPSDPFPVANVVVDQRTPFLAAGGATALAAWREAYDDRRSAIVSAAGARPLDLQPLQVAFDGKEFVAISGRKVPAPDLEYSAQFLSPAGDAAGPPVSLGVANTVVLSGTFLRVPLHL